MSSYQSYSSGMGERILNIGEFRGIDQSRGDHGVDYGTSPDAVNFISRYGKLYTAGGTALYGAPAGLEEDCQGRLCQAFFRNPQGEDTTKLLMFVNGCIYAADADASEWVQIGSGFHSDNWDVVNYRDGISDLAIMTNGLDNVQYWDGWSPSVSMLLNAEEDVEEEIEEEPEDDSSGDDVLEEPVDIVEPDYIISVGESIDVVVHGSIIDADNEFVYHYFQATSSDPSIASVPSGNISKSSDAITITGVSPGEATISAQGFSSSLADLELLGTATVSVRSHCTDISIVIKNSRGNSFNSEDLSYLFVGKTYTVEHSFTPENCTDSFALKSSNEKVAIVSGNNSFTVVGPGVAKIICSAVDSTGEHCVREYEIVAYSIDLLPKNEIVEEVRLITKAYKNPYLFHNVKTSERKIEYYSAKYEHLGYKESGDYFYNYSLLLEDPLSSITNGIPANSKILKCEVDFSSFSEVVDPPFAIYPAPSVWSSRIHSIKTQFSYLDGDVTVESFLDAFKNRKSFDGWMDVTEQVLNNISMICFLSHTAPDELLCDTGIKDVVGGIDFRVTIQYNPDGSEIEDTTPVVVPEPPVPIKQAGDTLIFSQIALLRERLWGAVSPLHPDRIYWSNTFDPSDWELDWEDSSNVGGGFIDIATFDGTRIRAILTAFDEILVFKDKSIHRITGSVPGEFSVGSVYSSEGTLAPRSIVYTGDKVYFLSVDGLCVYNGVTATPLSSTGDRKLKNIWSRINESTISTACAVLKDNIIYLAVPLDGSIINTHVIEYNLYDGTYSIVELPGVDDWLLMREGQKETLLFLDGNGVYQYDMGYTFAGEPINAYWISPEISGSSMSARKTTGRIYMRIEARSLDISKQPYIKLTMSNGVKSREKLIRLNNGMNDIRKRIKIRGRTFRFKIENVDGNPITIHRGVEICTEEDFD